MGRALPPGQIETLRFPVVGERVPSPQITDWRLQIGGEVRQEKVLDLDQYMGLDHRDLVFDIHCVTSWTRFDSRFTGVPLHELVDPGPKARFVSFGSYSDRGHHTSLPIDYAMKNSWVVHAFEGAPLSSSHGGPVRVVTPGKYFYKSIKWLRSLMLVVDNRLGWWETNSDYHNNADPSTGDQRFTTGSVRPQQLQRFLGANSYDKYRNRVMLGLDLTAWRPSTGDLSRLHLKNCDLRGVDLSRADLRNCNLSLCSLAGARLVDANLSGSDLEGVDFTGADLRGADLRHTALSAARFDDAVVDGTDFEGSWGLLETQARYLEDNGVSLAPDVWR